mgnify:FL=1
MSEHVGPYTPEEIDRSRALALLLAGFTAAEVADMLHRSLEWIYGF